MILEPLTVEGAKRMLRLREQNRAAMRTNAPINERDQEEWFYQATARNAPQRWWSVRWAPRDNGHIGQMRVRGYGGVEHIDWISRAGELSLLIEGPDEAWRNAFDLLLNKAFDELNLVEVHAEVYHCSPDYGRWDAVRKAFSLSVYGVHPAIKFWKGRRYDADLISWRLPV